MPEYLRVPWPMGAVYWAAALLSQPDRHCTAGLTGNSGNAYYCIAATILPEYGHYYHCYCDSIQHLLTSRHLTSSSPSIHRLGPDSPFLFRLFSALATG